jgi:hypothetical protein
MSKKRNVQRGLAPATCYAPLLVLPTTTTPENLVEIRNAGYVAVLCDSPEKVVVVMPQTRMAGDDLLMSALHGLAGTCSTAERSKMVEELHRRLLKTEGA